MNQPTQDQPLTDEHPKASIRFETVSKRYGDTVALQEMSCRIPEKQITAVVGRSGSGKTTLLQLINGLERPTSGRVYVYDEPVDYKRIIRLRRRLGYAVQGTGLFPHMTVARNILLPALIDGWERETAEARARELMKLTNLQASLWSRYPHELSGGQQQRVGLCRAMMLDPEILLFDEPFGALDPITRSEIHEELLKLQAMRPRTIVLVTHDMREAVKLADHLMILEGGKLLQSGPCQEVLASPANDFVATLVHSQLEG